MRRSIVITFTLFAALLVPAQAFAIDEPDVVDDPPAAVEDAAAATIDLNELPEAAAEETPAAAPAPAAQASVPTASAPVSNVSSSAPRGELPFTGPGDVVASILLALVLILAGIALRSLPGRRAAERS